MSVQMRSVVITPDATRVTSRDARGQSSGVTLLELLVVVAIASVMLAVVFPSVGSGLRGLELSSAARRVAAAARYAREQAVHKQSTLQLEIDTSTGRISVIDLQRGSESRRQFVLPESVCVAEVLPQEREPGSTRRFLFTPDGAAPAFQVMLANERRQMTVSGDPLTGTATVSE